MILVILAILVILWYLQVPYHKSFQQLMSGCKRPSSAFDDRPTGHVT